MRDPKWIGSQPSGLFWAEDGSKLYFNWNPEGAESDSLYVLDPSGGEPRKLSLQQRRALPARGGDYNRNHSQKVYAKYGDIYLLDIASGNTRQITFTVEQESAPVFSQDEQAIIYRKDNNLYRWSFETGTTVQLTDFRQGKAPAEEKEPQGQRAWLQQEELRLIEVLRSRKEEREARQEQQEAERPDRPKRIYLNGQRLQFLQLSPDERFVTYLLIKMPRGQNTKVPNYITETGYTDELNARPKVGSPGATYQFMIYDRQQDTVYAAQTDDIPGIDERPAYLTEYAGQEEQQQGEEAKEAASKKQVREVMIMGPLWSDEGKYAAVVVRSLDFKDRWIMLLDPATGKLKNLDRQHDEAWIDGPGIGRWLGSMGSIGWLGDNRSLYFQSEASGYSHLYTLEVESGKKKQLTKGKYEVFNPQLSRDKRHFYFTSSEVHPGERHVYRMPVEGGKAVQLTSMRGNNSVVISPDERWLAIRYSYSNQPWQLYLAPNEPKATARRITHSISAEFLSYPWRDPEIVTFQARDGARVYARLYRPANAAPAGPAVIFVHGAGYLQNVHKWWSSYFREYMFHNLLADRGYTVLDIDFRASAGYGRDWRTAVYRNMGGKDLDDQVDGAKFLVDKYGVDPARIGIYGGSYGGFITLMAMFKQPETFRAGAALRPVTDWAHYNHGYTASMLNEPQNDSLAYIRSSPIYHAEGLQGALLICHGMIDTNVHFQDVVRLVQRLIELGKENWETAIYPLEGHGFREPSSWTDEYRRILKLFESNLR
ncbi:MAG: S9 family peptidase [Bacteroidetes bacterium]|nr:MAG: S9 family peptidase [Bacteroidota bacterium]